MIPLLALLCQDWTELPAKIEKVQGNVYVTFQPIALSALRVSADFDRAQAWGVDGKVDAEVSGRALRFAKRPEVAEVVLFGCAGDVKVEIWKSESKREARKIAEKDLEEVGDFKPTFYWVLLEEKFDGERDRELPGIEGKFPKDFVKQARIEGTAKLRDGRVVNVWGKGFKVVDAPNGLGAGGYHLIPFRSIAVDRDEIALGTKLFIREAVGMKLPDGSVHDGMFYAHDVGGGIQGKRIDFFTGPGRQQSVFEKAGLSNMKALKLYRVK